MTASTPLLITFGIYLLLMLGIGFVAWRSTRSFDDYILGGRSLGSYVTALSAGASDMSGWLLMGLPGAMYLGGVSEAWIAIGLVAGAWANWKFVADVAKISPKRQGAPRQLASGDLSTACLARLSTAAVHKRGRVGDRRALSFWPDSDRGPA